MVFPLLNSNHHKMVKVSWLNLSPARRRHHPVKVPDAGKLNMVVSKVCTKRKGKHNKSLAGSSLRVLLSDLPLTTGAVKGQSPSIAL